MTDLRFWEARELSGYRHDIQVSYGLPFNWRLLASLVVNLIAWGAVVAVLARWW